MSKEICFKKKGQFYIITTFIVLGLMLYVIWNSNFENEIPSYQEYYVLDTLLDVIYSGYNISCNNLNAIVNLVYGNIDFAYLVFNDNKYKICDPSNIIEDIKLEGEYYKIHLKRGEKYLSKIENERTKYMIFIISKDNKLYIKEGTLK